MPAEILHFESKDALVAYATGTPMADGFMAAPIQGGWVQPWVQAFADAVVERFDVGVIGTYNGHDPSIDLALDIFVDPGTGNALAEWAIGQYERYAIDYHIWWQRIYNPERGAFWRDMEDRGSWTQNHKDHNHYSFEADGPTAPIPPPEEDPLPALTEKEQRDLLLLVRDLHAYMSQSKGGKVDTIEEAIAGEVNETKWLAGSTNAQVVAFFAAFDPQYPDRKDIDLGRERLVALLKSLEKKAVK